MAEFSSKAIAEHAEVPLADDGRWEALVDHWRTRESIILNVFLRHASTRRAKIQVEIAQLEYLRPRIRGVGLDMDQQTGGMARARGPGETASELLARKLDGRLDMLKKALRRLETS